MKYNKNTFYCFSPPVMIATFIIEVGLALCALWRYKVNTVTRLAVIMLLSLATFQLAEYMVCQGLGGSPLFWSRLGFAAITVLPPVGLHLLHVITKSKRRWIPLPGYMAAAGFMAFFAFSANSIVGNQCLGNYVIFQVGQHYAGGVYAGYYYGLLIVSLLFGWYHVRQKHDQKTRQAIAALMVGYSIFLIPTTAAVLADPGAVAAIPSVMCGFAVLQALALGLLVLPASAIRRRR
jgi:hypothetical protein